MKPIHARRQKGVTLIVGMIMLILITIMVTSAFTLSMTNLKSVGNMQFRNEAIAAANKSIEEVIGTKFAAGFAMPPAGAASAATPYTLDINHDGTADYTVKVGTEIALVGGHYVASPGSGQWLEALCIQSTSIAVSAPGTASSETLAQLGIALSPNVNSALFDIRATVTDAISGASAEVHQGIRVQLDEAQKALMCP